MMKQIYYIFASLLLLFQSALLHADKTTVRGFSTIGLVKSNSGDELTFRRNLARTAEDSNAWSFKSDTTLGVQVDTILNDQWSASAQLVYKNRIDQSLENSIEWAYLRYHPSPDNPFSYRIGRLGVDVFMLSEYRNVGYAYLWARPPIEFYSPLAFDYIDGADITYSTLLEESFFQARLTVGTTQNDFVYDDVTLKVSPAIATSLLWESDYWKLRLGYAHIELSDRVDFYEPLIDALNSSAPLWPDAASAANDLNLEGKKFDYYTVGLTYDNNQWIVQTEINQVKTKDNIFTSSHSGYISLGRRVGDYTLYGIGSIIENTDDINQVAAVPDFLPPLAQAQLTGLRTIVQDQYNQTGVDQKSLGLGVRWDVYHNTAIKFQWDRTWVKPHGAGLWAKDSSLVTDETVDTFSINVNFLF
ncbi:hypothetical protein [Neptuniibacter sp. QD34_54]|uniref:hypothetical protein n=1 Tax=Neptuniibacter sp. QD34_54 TaxID=3398208 RepID=UPI0039F62E94